MPSPRLIRNTVLFLVGIPLGALTLRALIPSPQALQGHAAAGPADTTLCTLELRSWVVAARGRHLYLDCDCPPPFEHLNDRIEFTTASLRADFDRAAASSLFAANPNWAPNVARMTRGTHLAPIIAEPLDRLEQTYEAPASLVMTLQRDAVFSQPYRLLGPNSNSALRVTLEAADLPLPAHVLASGGVLGEFPGVTLSPGLALPIEQWASSAVTPPPTHADANPGPAPNPDTTR